MNSKFGGAIFMLLLATMLLVAGCTTTTSPNASATPGALTSTSAPASLLVYSGAGLKASMEEIGQAFTNKTGIPVQFNYAGGGTLISQMNLTKKGDVFIPGSTVEYWNAKNQSLVGTYRMVAYHVPVIAVVDGNPKNITTLMDFARPGLKIALGDVNATAIGKAGAKMFKKLNITAAVEKNVVTRAPTINELVIYMNTGQADAALLTLDQIDDKTMDSVSIPVKQNEVLIVPVGVTTFTENTDAAGEFVDFVASDEGKAFFAAHGFPTFPNATYAGVA